MQDITKQDIGKTYYFVETIEVEKVPTNIIYCGILVGVLPKYQFLDAYNSEYKREQNYIFRVQGLFEEFKTKAITSPRVAFERLGEAIGYCKETPLMHYSVMLEQHKKGKN